MIIRLHTPAGIISIDSETVTDDELEGAGMTRDSFNDAFNLVDITRATELLANPPTAITQPEMWELMRIFGRLLGIS